MNRAACELVGVGEADLVGMDLECIIGRTDFRERIAAAVRSGTPINDLKTAALGSDGTTTPVSVTATQLTGRNVEDVECEIHLETTCDCVAPPAAMVLVARDLTAIRRAERTRRASYEVVSASQHAPTLDSLYESVHGVLVSMMTIDHFAIALRDRHDGRLLAAYSDDPHGEENEVTSGLVPRAMTQNGPTHLRRGQIEELVADGVVEMDGEIPEEWLGIPLRANDETIGVLTLASGTPGSGFSDDDVKLAAFICDQVARAIEGRREAEERARLSSAVEHAADAIVLTDATRAVEYMNVAFQRLSGWSEDDVRGKDLLALGATKEDVAARQQIWMVVEREGAWSGRMQSRRKDGSLYEADVSISCVRDEDGHVIHYVSVEHDVTNEVALEAQLRQAQKMEAVGKLAGGVAHDFNNLLSVINGYASILLGSAEPDSPERDHTEEILRAGERAAGLTRQLLAFSRRQVLKPRILELNAVVRDMEKMLRRLIGEDVDLHTVMDESVGTVEADPGQLEQVVMNLAVNARDAMLRGGRLTIETGQRYLGEEYCAHHAELEPGHYALLAITDSGHGMSALTAARIFEPFFTTKETGKGTGLGLSTVYGIVKQSGGHVSVYSEVGRGTCFRIYLPRVGAVDEELADDTADEPAAMGQETVLVAEDEDGVRKLAALLLKRQGYNVLQAEDGESALRVAAQHDGPIHLLLTDVVMPRMSGRELWDVLSTEREETRVLYMSGYTDTAIVHHGVLEPGTPFIEKPFVPDELLSVIRGVLDGEPATLGTA